VWPPLVMLILGVVADIEMRRGRQWWARPIHSVAVRARKPCLPLSAWPSAAVLCWGLWTSRNCPYVPDIGNPAGASRRGHTRFPVAPVRFDWRIVLAPAGFRRRWQRSLC